MPIGTSTGEQFDSDFQHYVSYNQRPPSEDLETQLRARPAGMQDLTHTMERFNEKDMESAEEISDRVPRRGPEATEKPADAIPGSYSIPPTGQFYPAKLGTVAGDQVAELTTGSPEQPVNAFPRWRGGEVGGNWPLGQVSKPTPAEEKLFDEPHLKWVQRDAEGNRVFVSVGEEMIRQTLKAQDFDPMEITKFAGKIDSKAWKEWLENIPQGTNIDDRRKQNPSLPVIMLRRVIEEVINSPKALAHTIRTMFPREDESGIAAELGIKSLGRSPDLRTEGVSDQKYAVSPELETGDSTKTAQTSQVRSQIEEASSGSEAPIRTKTAPPEFKFKDITHRALKFSDNPTREEMDASGYPAIRSEDKMVEFSRGDQKGFVIYAIKNSGKHLDISYIGFGKEDKTGYITHYDSGGWSLGPEAIFNLLKQVKKENPYLETIGGFRVSGARTHKPGRVFRSIPDLE